MRTIAVLSRCAKLDIAAAFSAYSAVKAVAGKAGVKPLFIQSAFGFFVMRDYRNALRNNISHIPVSRFF